MMTQPTEKDVPYAVPDPVTRGWLVQWHDLSLSLNAEQYDALKRAALDDPREAMRLAEEYAARDEGKS